MKKGVERVSEIAYRPWNQEAGEEVPYPERSSCHNGCNVHIWSHGHCHHAQESGVQECQEHNEKSTDKENSCIHGTHGIEQVLCPTPVNWDEELKWH
nr:hypothetical protein Itr_chr03CG00720 [Ipomoea trifida]